MDTKIIKKYMYVWLLPLIWAASSLLSLRFPGDEYGLYAASSMAGTWIVFIIKPQGAPHDAVFWLTITTTGIVVMTLAGLWLKFIKIKPWIWFGLYITSAVFFCLYALFSYPSLEKAISKNGSLWAYIFSSLNIGLYASVILSSIWIAIKKQRLKHSQKKQKRQ